jgi:hypothetical protein
MACPMNRPGIMVILLYVLFVFMFVSAGVLFVDVGASDAVKVENAPVTFVVTSIKNETDDRKWSNQLIAIGIRNLINEELLDTGCLVPLETDPEITEKIDNSIKNGWMLSGKKEGALLPPVPKHGAEVEAVIRKMSKSRVNFFLGPFSSGKTTITVVVGLTIRLADGTEIKSEGSGEGKTKTSGFLFQIRKDKIYFDESSVGRATHKAVREAVKALELGCGAGT